jgi:hypothetical protein
VGVPKTKVEAEVEVQKMMEEVVVQVPRKMEVVEEEH